MKKAIVLLFLFTFHKYVFAQSHDNDHATDFVYPTTYVQSFDELIVELQDMTLEEIIFFVSYDETGNIVHSVPIKVTNLILFICKHQKEMPRFCIILLPDRAIRKIK